MMSPVYKGLNTVMETKSGPCMDSCRRKIDRVQSWLTGRKNRRMYTVKVVLWAIQGRPNAKFYEMIMTYLQGVIKCAHKGLKYFLIKY